MPSHELITLSLHDALPISEVTDPFHRVIQLDAARLEAPVERGARELFATSDLNGRRRLRVLCLPARRTAVVRAAEALVQLADIDRKSTRLNSSHLGISYAVPRAHHSFPTRRSSDLRSDGPLSSRHPTRRRASRGAGRTRRP